MIHVCASPYLYLPGRSCKKRSGTRTQETPSSTNHASLCILGEANPQEESGLKMQRALDKDLVCTGICENRLTATWWDHC